MPTIQEVLYAATGLRLLLPILIIYKEMTLGWVGVLGLVVAPLIAACYILTLAVGAP